MSRHVSRTPVVAAVAAVAALVALVVGCGSSDEGEATASGSAAATQSSGSAASTIAGDYQRTLTAADIKRTADLRQTFHQEAGPNQEPPKPAPIALTLTDGTLEFTDRGTNLTILQDFSATSDGVLRLGAYQHPEEGSFCGPEIQQTAAYSWELSGDVLELKATQDPCADRDSYLTGAWERG